ncbi:MAG: transcription termination/antitermination protein NusG [Gammaproteobacteria bacterium]|nr:transcription termination/antitermination protein NusG [Gammaproteobacteria bacterium]MCY4200204.1 transcription termination/antitermination protein NusG [Gammaproteobacteria bacterium]MCY4278491.1 transcription termination/antitermination protein NusG [Gammaproteobacteria bacterium]MCY4324381.1 transcription termination/antitermination protein NusG [Gammaproteobacteria bacterium]
MDNNTATIEPAADAKPKRWYVVQAYSGYEKAVKRALDDRIRESAIADCFGDVLVPIEEVVEMRGGQKRRSERKFFPGYVLVEMRLNDHTWHLVKDTPKVLGFIGGKADDPTPLTPAEAESILAGVEAGRGDKARPKIIYEPGEIVRVTEGPFNDFSGVVETVDYENSKLKVAVTIFGRSTPVELEFTQVEKG